MVPPPICAAAGNRPVHTQLPGAGLASCSPYMYIQYISSDDCSYLSLVWHLALHVLHVPLQAVYPEAHPLHLGLDVGPQGAHTAQVAVQPAAEVVDLLAVQLHVLLTADEALLSHTPHGGSRETVIFFAK